MARFWWISSSTNPSRCFQTARQKRLKPGSKSIPGVEILSRDRSKTYKRGMSQGAPEAIQVADRFHLLHNLEETLETVFKGHHSVLQQVEKDQRLADGLEGPQPSDLPEDPPSPKALNRAHRLGNI
jgi:transposase